MKNTVREKSFYSRIYTKSLVLIIHFNFLTLFFSSLINLRRCTKNMLILFTRNLDDVSFDLLKKISKIHQNSLDSVSPKS